MPHHSGGAVNQVMNSSSPADPGPAGPKILYHDEWVPNRNRRRIAAALAGTAAGALLGTVGYPWIAGSRQKELASLWDRAWNGAPQSPRELVQRIREEAGDRESTHRPMVLDATGMAYQTFLEELKLQHIRPLDLLAAHFRSRQGVNNELPGRHLWKNMVATLRIADRLQDELGVRLVTIASAYRSPAYNATCPGAAPQSFHLQNLALDLVYDCPPAKVAEAAHALRNRGLFRGGIGKYPSFTHIDTRGKNADWG